MMEVDTKKFGKIIFEFENDTNPWDDLRSLCGMK